MTASANSVYLGHPDHCGPQFILDDLPPSTGEANQFLSRQSVGEWVRIDTKGEVIVSKVVLTNRMDGSQSRQVLDNVLNYAFCTVPPTNGNAIMYANRTILCTRYQQVSVAIAMTSTIDGNNCGEAQSYEAGKSVYTYECEGLVGRYIIVSHTSNNFLQLNDATIFGCWVGLLEYNFVLSKYFYKLTTFYCSIMVLLENGQFGLNMG